MVPFVDVVLVLLIIFMITAPILQSGIEVDVPKTKTIKDISQDRLDPVNIHELGAKVHAQLKNTQRSVFLRCDEAVPFGVFASVIDTLRVSGINNISIVTEPLTERARAK